MALVPAVPRKNGNDKKKKKVLYYNNIAKRI